MKIPFSPPYIDQDVIDEVTDSLQSGWITTGPKCKALEAEIKALTGAGAVLTVNSWTSGAILCLKWLGLQPGDEVIIPAYTYAATALAVIHAGGTPVMVDCGEDFNISVDAIERAITSKTKAIIPVDIAGLPCDYAAINALVKREDIRSMYQPNSEVQDKLKRILVLNDAAHSIGAKYSSKEMTGSCTDIAIFSLHAVKNITTAEGGAICLNLPAPFDNDSLYTELRMMSLNCQTKDAFSKTKAGNWRYDIIGPGLKMNMADINAAIGLAQIRKIAYLQTERQRVFDRYTEALANKSWAILPPRVLGERRSSCHIFALRLKDCDEARRDAIIEEISKHDVAVNVHFMPLPMLSYFKGLGFDIADYPIAFHNYASEISLPIYPQLTDEMVDHVVATLINAYEATSN